MKCLECRENFTPLSVTQKYCSLKCGAKYRWKNRGKIKYPSITFSCRQCGHTVVTEDGSRDRRTDFCCASCEKKFWRRPPWENTTGNINFHDVKEYANYERRTNA